MAMMSLQTSGPSTIPQITGSVYSKLLRSRNEYKRNSMHNYAQLCIRELNQQIRKSTEHEI